MERPRLLGCIGHGRGGLGLIASILSLLLLGLEHVTCLLLSLAEASEWLVRSVSSICWLLIAGLRLEIRCLPYLTKNGLLRLRLLTERFKTGTTALIGEAEVRDGTCLEPVLARSRRVVLLCKRLRLCVRRRLLGSVVPSTVVILSRRR